MTRIKATCAQCGQGLHGYYQFDVCSTCHSSNVDEQQKKLLADEAIKWIECRLELPPDNEVVRTKIDDKDGPRNEAHLARVGNLWFFPDMSMYVYYYPTHWSRDERPTHR